MRFKEANFEFWDQLQFEDLANRQGVQLCGKYFWKKQRRNQTLNPEFFPYNLIRHTGSFMSRSTQESGHLKMKNERK